MKTAGIILAGGRGTRFGSDMPKQFHKLLDRPVICYSIDAFEKSMADEIILVTGEEYISYTKELVSDYGYKKVKAVIPGGSERYLSGYNGIMASDADAVLIHDGARPLIKPEYINEHVRALSEHEALIAAARATDTIKAANEQGFITSTPDRRFLWHARTPQSFDRKRLIKAYEKLFAALENGELDKKSITDDAFIWEQFESTPVKVVEEKNINPKITEESDLKLVEYFLKNGF